MLFVRVVRKKLNGKRALPMFEVFWNSENKHLPKKFYVYFILRIFKFRFVTVFSFRFTYVWILKTGGIGFRKVQKYRIVIMKNNKRLGMKVHMSISNFWEQFLKMSCFYFQGLDRIPTQYWGLRACCWRLRQKWQPEADMRVRLWMRLLTDAW